MNYILKSKTTGAESPATQAHVDGMRERGDLECFDVISVADPVPMPKEVQADFGILGETETPALPTKTKYKEPKGANIAEYAAKANEKAN